MERSEINNLIKSAEEIFIKHGFILPKFSRYTPKDWQEETRDISEILELMLGWDVTDFGSGNFKERGLLLFTLRNGMLGSEKYNKVYAEKIMLAENGQVTPWHFHRHKMEDIINRGGGDLVINLYNSDENEGFDESVVEVSVSGIKTVVSAGDAIILKQGESVCLPPYMYHTFKATGSYVVIGEVSMVNDDSTDNRFYEEVGRFPEIVEDTEIARYLTIDYDKYLKK